MSDKGDRLALRGILTLVAVLGAVVLLRNLSAPAGEWFSTQWNEVRNSLASIGISRVSEAAPKPVAATAAKPVRLEPELSEPVEPEVRKAISVVRPSILIVAPPPPLQVVVPVSPKEWSRLVEVPPGRSGTITFSLGRIRVERNGVDVGLFYRKPSLQARRVNEQVIVGKVDLGALFDKTPRTLHLDAGTQTLRFRSEERVGGEVTVDLE